MGDPERLLGSMNASDELERDLLGSLRDVAPPSGAKGETWKRLVVPTAAVATIGATSTALHGAARSTVTAAAQGTKMLAAKILVGAVVTGSTVAGGGFWMHQRTTAQHTTKIAAPLDRPSLAPPEGVRPEAAEPAPLPPAAIELAERAAPPLVTPSRAGDRPPKAADDTRARNDLLSLESRMLTEARAELHASDPRAALQTLERLRARSPKGVLVQEREVLTIQVLSALGDNAAAKRKAKEFLEAHPESPHTAQLRRLAADP
jgi:hypothetical protein